MVEKVFAKSDKEVDLRGIPCPVNLIRIKLILEDLNYNQKLKVYLDKGEPQETVVPSLIQSGHSVQVFEESDFVKLMVTSGAT